MNRNLNVFWGLVLCVGMIGGLIVLSQRGESGSKNGNPNEFYNSSSARTYSHVSSSAAVADGVGVPMSSTSAMRRGSSFVYAPAYTTPNSPITTSPNGPIASSPITYTSSSAMTKSFGGGNAMGGGVSMSGGAVRSAGGSVSMSGGAVSGSFASSPLASSPLASNLSPLASSPNSLIASSPVVITDPAAAAASYEGMGNTTSGPRGIRGRQKVGPGAGSGGGGLAGSWMEWFYRYGIDHGTDVYDEETRTHTYSFTWYQLQEAYQQYLNEFWDGMWTPTNGAPSIYEWLEWLEGGGDGGYGYEGNFYRWQPIGDVWPLLVIALLYALILAIKSSFFKSLLTTERSE